jgi:hypothetical protein
LSRCNDGKQPYLENNKYKDIFKDKPDKKKLGFLTSDFPKRDEFSNVSFIRRARSSPILQKAKRTS